MELKSVEETPQERAEAAAAEWAEELATRFREGKDWHSARAALDDALRAAESTKSEFPPIRPLSEVTDQETEPPPEIIEGMLYQGGKLTISGPSKGRKTWLLLHLAAAVANGAAWLGMPTRKKDVLFLDLELMPFETPKRARKIMRAAGFDDESKLHLWQLRGHAATLPTLKEQIAEFCRRREVGLIGIDPYYRISAGAEENSNTEIARFLGEIEGLAHSTGAAVAMSHHFAKGSAAGKNSIDRASGAGAFARDPDAILTMTESSESTELEPVFVVESAVRSFKPVPAFAIRWSFPLWIRDDDAGTTLKGANGDGPQATAEEISELLDPKGMTSGEIVKLAGSELGLSRRRVFELLKSATAKKLIEKAMHPEDHRKTVYRPSR